MLTAILAASLWSIPAIAEPTDQLLMRAWYVQNDECRGGEGHESVLACRWRENTGRVLEARGWIWTSRYGWASTQVRALRSALPRR